MNEIKLIDKIYFKQDYDLNIAICFIRSEFGETVFSEKLLRMIRNLEKSLFNYIEIQLDVGEISIENRQSYCDRGRFIVKVDSRDHERFHIDDQDMFPRYYFNILNLFDELGEWLKKRKINIVSISLMEIKE